MSVLIKGFEMPKDGCKDCVMVERGFVYDICPFLKREVNGNVKRGGKPNGCPLIEVPDTNVGDTISRQAAIDAIEEYSDRLQMVNWKENPGVPYKVHALNWCVNTIRELPSA